MRNKCLLILFLTLWQSDFAQQIEQFKNIKLQSIEPQGWIQEFLVRQKNGLGGYPHVSGYPFNTKMWEKDIEIPQGHLGMKWWPYEQTGYYLDGIHRVGYLLKDSELVKRGKLNVEKVLNTSDEDKVLGPKNADDWSRVVFFRMLMAEYEETQNIEMLEKLTDHFLFKKRLFNKGRALLSIEPILWLYEKTKNKKLLALAKESFQANKNSKQGGEYSKKEKKKEQGSKLLKNLLSDKIPSGHGVSYLEMVKIPAILYLHTGDSIYLKASVNGFKKLEKYHLLVDGTPSSIEYLNGKKINTAHETCDTSDLIWSATYLLKATQHGHWGDVIEKALFNAGFGAIDKEFKTHQYYSAPNQPVAAENTSQFNINLKWGKKATGRMCYRTSHDTECCTGNIQRLMPAYVGNMWMVEKENKAVVATLFGASSIETEINNQKVIIEEKTQYPFSEDRQFNFKLEKSTKFSFVMRVPEWCLKPEVIINNKRVKNMKVTDGFLTIKRKFKNQDQIKLNLPMNIKFTYWGKNKEGVAVERGPLVYTIPVESKTIEFPFIGGEHVEDFPNKLMYPANAWGYALNTSAIKFEKREVGNNYPWDLKTVPNKLKIKAKKILNWKLKGTKHVGVWPNQLQLSNEYEEIEMLPLGATYLRMTILPEIK